MNSEKSSTTFLRSLSGIFGKRSPRTPEEFRAVFDKFKKLLDSDNHALEAITDMGEKLGGDYLFDIVYLRNAYARLKGDMEQSLRAFDELTNRSYPRLHEVFQKIDGEVSRMLTDLPVPAVSLVLSLRDIPWGSGRDVGRKMAQVAEVKNQLGMTVPDGFVITTAAFDAFVKFNRLEERIHRLSESTSTVYDQNDMEDLILHGAMPPELSRAIKDVMKKIARVGADAPLLAVRSSAEEEDGSHSFAGQFRTVLGVPFEQGEVEKAYRRVIASLYSDKAVAYQQQMGYSVGKMKMAVGCMVMIDAVSSGVMFSTTPEGDAGTMMISAAWGLGESVVEAGSGSDLYLVRKDTRPEPVKTTIGKKESMIAAGKPGGTVEVTVPEEAREKACLSPEQIRTLAMAAMQIERYFGGPRDIEWAIDSRGTMSILQARPLTILDRDRPALQDAFESVSEHDHPMLVNGQGLVVQSGTGAGKVFIAARPTDIQSMPKGSVLVAPHDSSLFIRSMPYVSAIITERGSQTSHMASLCRELRVPTIVNLPRATEVLKQGQEVTVVSDPEKTVVYSGIIAELVLRDGQGRQQMEQLYEYRKKRSILRDLSPLHLIDPLMDEFTPERCRTMHDILRFMHEKAVAELVESGRSSGRSLSRRRSVVPLDLPVPAGLMVMDLGGGLQHVRQGTRAGYEQIASIPFKAVVRGMLHPGVWRDEPVGLKTGDFISSMIRMPDIADVAGSTAGYNIAVISRDYLNMSIRFGYHYNMIDCYCSDTAKNNHLYFRFSGGATDLVKRSRRLDLIGRILINFGFIVRVQGDILTGRLAGHPREQMEEVLERTGRLVAYARQLDAVLHDDSAVERYGRRFLEGTYGL